MAIPSRSEEHTSELQSPCNLVCRLLLEKKKRIKTTRSFAGTAARPRALAILGAPELPRVHPTLRPRIIGVSQVSSFFFFNDTATPGIYTLSLHDALPISRNGTSLLANVSVIRATIVSRSCPSRSADRKSTRLNSSHLVSSYAVFSFE